MSNDTPSVKRAYNLGLKAVPNFIGLSDELVAYYEKHLDEIPKALERGFIVPVLEINGKFELLREFSLTVPKRYNCVRQLSGLNPRDFSFFNEALRDKNFKRVTDTLIPGRPYTVKIFGIGDGLRATSEECLALYAQTSHSLFTGAQGLSLVYQLARNKLPKNKWIASFDEKEALWKDINAHHRVPDVFAGRSGVFGFDLGYFGNGWDSDCCVLCFCDE